jgi:hypothetical protein
VSTVRLLLDTPLAASLDCETRPLSRLSTVKAYVVDWLRADDADVLEELADSNRSRLYHARVALREEATRQWSKV